MTIYDITSEYDGVLCLVEEGDHVDIHGGGYHCDTSNDKEKTYLHVDKVNAMYSESWPLDLWDLNRLRWRSG